MRRRVEEERSGHSVWIIVAGVAAGLAAAAYLMVRAVRQKQGADP